MWRPEGRCPKLITVQTLCLRRQILRGVVVSPHAYFEAYFTTTSTVHSSGFAYVVLDCRYLNQEIDLDSQRQICCSTDDRMALSVTQIVIPPPQMPKDVTRIAVEMRIVIDNKTAFTEKQQLIISLWT